MYESVNRFLGHPEAAIQARMDELFGTDEWREIAKEKNATKRRDDIIRLYRRQLMEVGGLAYVRTFEMINEGNRTEYFLYFGTNSAAGFSKMKEAMWRVDPSSGAVFSDRTDTAQGVLLEADADVTPLRNALRKQFRGAGGVPIEVIERFVLEETPYSEAKHLKRRTLAPMEHDGVITASLRAGKRRKGTFPPGTQVIFNN
jgi:hypothetical protein